MNLDDDAAVAWASLKEAMPWPLHVMGVNAGRELSMPESPATPLLAKVEDVLMPHGDEELRLRVYRPEVGVELPAVLYFHGGGWSIGSLDGVDRVCRSLAALAHCIVISVDYRQAPENPFPAAHEDALAALTWLQANSSGLDVDPERIAVAGDSAGGNICAGLTLKCRDLELPGPCLQLLVYPAVECEWLHPSRWEHAHAPLLMSADVDWFWNLYLPDRADRDSPYAVPARAPSLHGLPPAVFIVADVDPLRDEVLAYARRLSKSGVAVEVARFPGVFHGFFTMQGTVAKADVAVAHAAGALSDAFAGGSPQPRERSC